MKKITVVLCFMLLAGCTAYYNPVTQKTEYTVYSEQDEIDMGTAADEKMRKENKILATPAKITEMAQKIGRASDRPELNYVIRIMENEEVNAFALPGGYIYLYTGLLDKVASNDEIANIIGHETAHICARDGVNQMQKSIMYSIPAQILLSNRSAAIQQAVDAAFTLTMLKYSREQELRADKLGVTYAYRAGYDPEGMIGFFRKLEEMEGTSSSTSLTFLRSHPVISERIENVRNVIAGLKPVSNSTWQKNAP